MPSALATLRASVPALLLSALVLVPFLDKPFTVDDTVFLFEARHALRDPLHPTAFEMTWAHAPERVSRLVPTGPVIAWLLVPCILAGGSEWAAHGVLLLAFWLAILATVSLARQLGLGTGWMAASGLLLVAMSAALAMAGTAMPDVPAMALGVAGLERLVAWGRERRLHQAAAAALLLGLAPLARPHLVLILGVAALAVLGLSPGLSPRRRFTGLAPLLVAPLVAALVLAATRDPDPGAGNAVAAAASYSSLSPERLATNLVAFPIHWVLALPFALPWTALRWRAILKSRLPLLAGAGGTALAALALAAAGRPVWVLAAIAGLGVAALADVLADGWMRRDWPQLTLGCWLLIGACTAPYAHLPPKYLVASAPAAALLLAVQMSRGAILRSRIVLAATLVAGTALGVAILRADAAFADVGRRAVAEMIAPRVALGQRVWFVGRWGFQWYAENAGAAPVTMTPPYPASGEVVVVTAASARSDKVLDMLGRLFPRSTVVGRLEDATPGGRIMNKRLGVGFYSNLSGYWPWTWADSVIDAYVALQLR